MVRDDALLRVWKLEYWFSVNSFTEITELSKNVIERVSGMTAGFFTELVPLL